MKKIVFLTLIAILILACNVQMMAATRTLKLAEAHPQGYPTELGDEKFAQLVEQKTKGKIKIQVYFGGQLGNENDVVEQCKLGVIEFIRVSTAPVITVYPEIGVFAMPYLFRSQEHQWKVLNSSIGKHFLEAAEPVGLVGLGYFEAGVRNFYANKPINSLADLKGMKIRVQPAPVPVAMVKALGAIPTPIAYGEVYSALQTGVVEGAENNYPSWVSAGHYEVAKYLLKDGHQRQPELVMASKKLWSSLSMTEKKAIKDAMKEATEFQIKAWNDYEGKALQQALAKGCIVKEANIAEFQAAVKSTYDLPEFKIYAPWVKKINAVK